MANENNDKATEPKPKKPRTSAKVKNRSNKKIYREYHFVIRREDKLSEIVDDFILNNPNKLSGLLKDLLRKRFIGSDNVKPSEDYNYNPNNNSAKVKPPYDNKPFREYRFVVRREDELSKIMDDFILDNPNEFSFLMRELLYNYFAKYYKL